MALLAIIACLVFGFIWSVFNSAAEKATGSKTKGILIGSIVFIGLCILISLS